MQSGGVQFQNDTDILDEIRTKKDVTVEFKTEELGPCQFKHFCVKLERTEEVYVLEHLGG